MVWGCVDGHTYVMDTNGAQARSNAGPETTKTQCDDGAKANKDDHQSASRTNSVHTASSGEAAAPQNHSSDEGRTQGEGTREKAFC